MASKLTLRYDRAADILHILHITSQPPYPKQETEELGDDVVARLNPRTGSVRVSRYCSSPNVFRATNSSSCP